MRHHLRLSVAVAMLGLLPSPQSHAQSPPAVRNGSKVKNTPDSYVVMAFRLFGQEATAKFPDPRNQSLPQLDLNYLRRELISQHRSGRVSDKQFNESIKQLDALTGSGNTREDLEAVRGAFSKEQLAEVVKLLDPLIATEEKTVASNQQFENQYRTPDGVATLTLRRITQRSEYIRDALREERKKCGGGDAADALAEYQELVKAVNSLTPEQQKEFGNFLKNKYAQLDAALAAGTISNEAYAAQIKELALKQEVWVDVAGTGKIDPADTQPDDLIPKLTAIKNLTAAVKGIKAILGVRAIEGIAPDIGVGGGDKAAEGVGTAIKGGVHESSTGVKPVGQFLKNVDDIFTNPQLLKGKTPAEVEAIIGKPPGWRVEALRQGEHEGEGWILREYGPKGEPTDKMIQWHPGGGRHSPDPYWKVSSGSGGTVRIGPQFP